MSASDSEIIVDNALTGEVRAVALGIIKSYDTTKTGILEILKSEQDQEIKKILIKHLVDIDNSLYDHFESINDVSDSIKEIGNQLKKQSKKQNKRYKRFRKQYLNKKNATLKEAIDVV